MPQIAVRAGVLVAALGLVGCGLNLGDAGGGGLFGSSSAFVLRGTMTVVNNGGPCPVFQADDGFSYHLRQGTNLPNDEFDAVTEIGAVSRVEVVGSELPVACQFGEVVVVVDVLEVIGPDGDILSSLIDDLLGDAGDRYDGDTDADGEADAGTQGFPDAADASSNGSESEVPDES